MIEKMKNIPIALQLYSIKDECARDLLPTLKAVAEMGYDGVEFAGYYGRSADELKSMLDELGLKVAGTHLGYETILGDQLKKTTDFNRILGNRFLIVPALPENMRTSRPELLKAARRMSEVAEKVKSEGMRIGYHAEPWDFKPIGKDLPWEIFFKKAKPEVVMQFDTGNAMAGGISSDYELEIMKTFPGRALTVHLKEFSSTNQKALIGEGEVKWHDFFKLCETVGGTEWYVVEQESYAFPPLECVKRCIKNLKVLLG